MSTDIDVALLSSTLERAMGRSQRYPAGFYRRLFKAHPELRALFHRNTEEAQTALFWEKLAAIVEHIQDPNWLRDELADMARLHAEYGVTSEMYPWVEEALIATLAASCGPHWSPEAEGAWREAYASLAASLAPPG